MITCLLTALLAVAPAQAGSADVGGYFRVAARPDLQGGNGGLGYWNLYGRLLNEGSYGLVELRYDVLAPEAGGSQPWTTLHTRIEGSSIANADASNGNLGDFRMSQVYINAGNVLLPHVTWQLGTLESFFGDLGLYDMRPATIFFDTAGLSARYDHGPVELLLGVGDSGWKRYGANYNAILTPGGTVRVQLGDHLNVGAGGEAFIEGRTRGNINAPYQTPSIDYEDYIRGEVTKTWLDEHPGLQDYFPRPEARSASSYNLVGTVGFGGFGPLVWSNLFVSYRKLHPDKKTSEEMPGFGPVDIYINDFTDQRTVLTVGNELQAKIIPDRLDLAWGALYSRHSDADNSIVPSDNDRWYASTVLRTQLYLTPTVHFLLENSLAREVSLNGNAYRQHADSVFANTGGVPDTRGLEFGDSDTRDTWQGKAGFVLSPLGTGIYTRPSLRVLYGLQQSSQNNAFGNNFVTSLDQFEVFDTVEQRLHQVLSLEAEVWF